VAQRDKRLALSEPSRAKRDALLLKAFESYAAAVQRAQDEDWPDEAFKDWRYRRATLARLLAREGMMQRVADESTRIRRKLNYRPTGLADSIENFWR
jgi:hypothetical protein